MVDGSLEKVLRRADYTLLRYQLRFDDDFLLPAYALLRLRRELSRVLKTDLSLIRSSTDFRDLLRPALPTDPALLRRVQQPAPGFIIHVDSLQAHRFYAGDLLNLPVCFLGRGIMLMEPFTRLLEALGSVGLCENAGRFQLESIMDGSAGSVDANLWSGGPRHLIPTIFDLSRQLEGFPPSAVKLEFITPARLLKNSRPLFRPRFDDIFPFVLRRVTGMLAAWADLEDIFDAGYLLECATRLIESDNRLNWLDWRPLLRHEEAGGVSGSVVLGGCGLAEIWTLLKLGELCGIGKGAAFGAGHYRLISNS